MKQKIKQDEWELPPTIGVILMILVALMSAAVVLPIYRVNQYYEIQTEEQLNKDYLLVKILNHPDNLPLQNVTIKVLEHGEGRLLSGPYFTNESGYTLIQIPHGYDKYFDIVGEFENMTNTKTIDKRNFLVESEDYLGPLGIDLINTFVSILIGGVVGWYWRGRKIKETPDTDEENIKSEDNRNFHYQPDSMDGLYR